MLFCVLAKSKEPFVWMGKIELTSFLIFAISQLNFRTLAKLDFPGMVMRCYCAYAKINARYEFPK